MAGLETDRGKIVARLVREGWQIQPLTLDELVGHMPYEDSLRWDTSMRIWMRFNKAFAYGEHVPDIKPDSLPVLARQWRFLYLLIRIAPRMWVDHDATLSAAAWTVSRELSSRF